MNVEELLELMEETLEAGTAVPFAASKRVVDVDRMRDIIDEVRNNLPDEVRESKKIVNDREQIMKNARIESESIIQQAEEKARNLTSEQEIVRRSQQYAAEIVTKAQAQAKELSRNATVYCEGILKNSECGRHQECPHESAQRRPPEPRTAKIITVVIYDTIPLKKSTSLQNVRRTV